MIYWFDIGVPLATEVVGHRFVSRRLEMLDVPLFEGAHLTHRHIYECNTVEISTLHVGVYAAQKILCHANIHKVFV